MNFQGLTIIIAVVILTIILGFIGFVMHQSKSNSTWPPMISECPDYWTVESATQCANTQNLGSCGTTMNFSAAEWQGNTGLKNKYAWAKKCGLTWDGITNNSQFTSI